MTEQKLKELLADMTLEEKVNQMSQVVGAFFNKDMDITAMGPMADKGFTPENVALSGSVLGTMGAETLKKIQKDFVEQHPHHIPMLFMLDVINGFKTIFPIPLGQGATFEPELSEKCAAVAAKEAAVSGLLVTFAADELDALLNVADEGNASAGSLHLTLTVSASLYALFDPIFGIVVTNRFCTGKALLPLSTERDVFSDLDLISDFLHELQKLVPVLRCDNTAVDGLL